MRSGMRILALGAISVVAVAALSSCDIISNLLGLKGTLQIQSVSATYDTTGGTGLKSITMTVQDSGGADATNVTYEIILNSHTTYDGNTAPVIYKGIMNGTIKSGSSQDIIVNASDIYTYVNDPSNSVGATDNSYYLGGVAYTDSATDAVNVINNQQIWWINNTFAVHSASGQLTNTGAMNNSVVTTATQGHYTVYVGLLDPNSPIFVTNNANLSLSPSQIFVGAWNQYTLNYDPSTGFATPINFVVGNTDSSVYNLYLAAFIDTTPDGKLSFDGSGQPAEPAVNYDASGGSMNQGLQINLGTDQTGLDFHF